MDKLISKERAVAAIKEYAESHTFNSFYRGMLKAIEIIQSLPAKQLSQLVSFEEQLDYIPRNEALDYSIALDNVEEDNLWIIDAVCNQVDKHIEHIASVDIPIDRWVPVTERLPGQKAKTYWVCMDCGYQCECRWTNRNPYWTDIETDWHWNIFDIPPYSKVVAWRQLPEPYLVENEIGDKDG